MPKVCRMCGHQLPKRAHRDMCAACIKAAQGKRPDRDPAQPITYDDVYPGVVAGVNDTPAFAQLVRDGLPAGTSVADYWRMLESATKGEGE